MSQEKEMMEKEMIQNFSTLPSANTEQYHGMNSSTVGSAERERERARDKKGNREKDRCAIYRAHDIQYVTWYVATWEEIVVFYKGSDILG